MDEPKHKPATVRSVVGIAELDKSQADAHRKSAFLLCRALALGLLSEYYPDTLGVDGLPPTTLQRRHVSNLLLNMTDTAIFHLAGGSSVIDAALVLYMERVEI